MTDFILGEMSELLLRDEAFARELFKKNADEISVWFDEHGFDCDSKMAQDFVKRMKEFLAAQEKDELSEKEAEQIFGGSRSNYWVEIHMLAAKIG